jgi:endonuclease/exonuclease/phosphatase (EEP) superfamily protein YafD
VGGLGWRRYPWLWVAVVPLLLWAVVRALGVDGDFPLIPLLAYTTYVAALAAIVAGVAVAFRNWAASLVAGMATLLLFAAILPRALGGGESIPPRDRVLRVLSANVHFGTADPAALVANVERLHVDLLSVQELTPRFAHELERAGIRQVLPDAIVDVDREASGGGLYSRFALTRVTSPPPRPFRMPYGLLSIDPGHRLRVVAVHTFPPKPGHVGLWREGLDQLPRADEGGGPPWLLTGDFNATLDFPPLRDLIGSGYRDAADTTGHGLEPTWPQGAIFPPPVTIDHFLADRRIAIGEYEVVDSPDSDHHAIFGRFGVPPSR